MNRREICKFEMSPKCTLSSECQTNVQCDWTYKTAKWSDDMSDSKQIDETGPLSFITVWLVWVIDEPVVMWRSNNKTLPKANCTVGHSGHSYGIASWSWQWISMTIDSLS